MILYWFENAYKTVSYRMSLKFEAQLGQSQLITLTFFHVTVKYTWVFIKANNGLHVIVTWKPFVIQSFTDFVRDETEPIYHLSAGASLAFSDNFSEFSVHSLTHLIRWIINLN